MHIFFYNILLYNYKNKIINNMVYIKTIKTTTTTKGLMKKVIKTV